MTEDLMILGVGVHAAEMADIVDRINGVEPRWNLLGFVRRGGDPHIDSWAGRPVLGGPEAVRRNRRCRVAFEHDFYDPVDVSVERWADLVDPSAFVASDAVVGPGCVIYPHGFVGYRATLGQRVFALAGSTINHDCVLGDYVTICSGVTLAGEVTVERGCYLGQACTIRQYVRIGAGSVIGMGGVVLHDVPAGSVMVGNPARKLRDIES